MSRVRRNNEVNTMITEISGWGLYRLWHNKDTDQIAKNARKPLLGALSVINACKTKNGLIQVGAVEDGGRYYNLSIAVKTGNARSEYLLVFSAYERQNDLDVRIEQLFVK